jgi:membrane-associated protein
MIDITALVKAAGYLGIFGVIFAESGLLIGILLPGDSVLFTAGILASQGVGHIWIVVLISTAAAILGDSTGYWLGRRFGPSVFNRKDSFLLDRRHVDRAQHFYEKHGTKTLIIARFTPIVRTLAPVLAGVGSMHYATFVTYNIVGGLLWGAGMPLLGYWLGGAVPNIDHYLMPIIVIIILASFTPGLWHLWRDRRRT